VPKISVVTNRVYTGQSKGSGLWLMCWPRVDWPVNGFKDSVVDDVEMMTEDQVVCRKQTLPRSGRPHFDWPVTDFA
jgi:hypothetical protein